MSLKQQFVLLSIIVFVAVANAALSGDSLSSQSTNATVKKQEHSVVVVVGDNTTINDELEKVNARTKRQQTSPCANNPCGAYGRCIPIEFPAPLPSRYQCICNEGFQGDQCQTEIDECASNPCRNGAECFNLINAFLCNCRNGFTGTFCETDTNTNPNNVCQPGTCGDGECQLTTHPTYPFVCKCKDNTYKFEPCTSTTSSSSKCSTSQPCYPNLCIDAPNSPSGYICQCGSNDYRPTSCQSTTTTCTATSCFNGGICVAYSLTERWCNPSQVGKTCCQCRTGFTGLQCETDIDECASSPCKNGATCNNLVNAYTCNCPTGFTGYNCETQIGCKQGNPCKFGGSCILAVDGTEVCQCKEGFTGVYCETDINECASSPCHNGGTCIDLENSYACYCPDGYFRPTFCPPSATSTTTNPPTTTSTTTTTTRTTTTSTTTTTRPTTTLTNGQAISVCQTNICFNGGSCFIVENSGFVCFCPTGYSGDLCQKSPIVPTTTSAVPTLCPNQAVCQNQGVCYIVGNTVRCVCPEGFTGSLCETFNGVTTSITTATTVRPTACTPNPCQNGGTCVRSDTGGFYGCFCSTGYIGVYCQTQQIAQSTTTIAASRGCSLSNPCRNGATCVNDNNGNFYGCFCATGYSGTYCDITSSVTSATSTLAPGCNPNPCLNGGVCTTRGCICPSGYSGQNCELLTTANLCQNIGCQNGGRCNVVKANLAECWCTTGYNGYYCELLNAGSRCSSVQCLNGGTCEERTPGITTYAYCMCKPGYTGARCETEYFRCTSNGIFNDVYGCANGRYLECAYYGQSQLGFPNGILYRRDCPPGLRYNPSFGYCDYAVNVKC